MKKLAKVALPLAGLMSSVSVGSVLAQEVNFWTLTFSSQAATDAFEEIAAEYEAMNPGVDIVFTHRGVDEHKTALRVAAGSESGPDIFFSWAGLGLGGDYVNAGMSLPLDAYYEQYNWGDILLPSAAAFADIYEGGKHGVPYTFKGEVVYYNKSLFEEAGITSEPQTYDELLAAAEALADKGIPAFTFGGTVNWHLMRLMDVLLETKCGAETHDALVGLDLNWGQTDCAVESFAELKMWAENYILSPFMGIDANQSFDLFNAGRAAMMLEGNWKVAQLRERGTIDQMDVFPFPTGTGRLYGFAEYNYVNSASKVADEAAAFLDYFISTDVQQRFLGKISTNSINSQVVYEDTHPMAVEWQEIFGKYTEMFVNGDQGFPASIVPEYFRVINEVASGNMEPQNAANALQTFIENNT